LQKAVSITLEAPIAEDGHAVHRLVGENPPLDPNSMYCNLLQCTHFADTCICAKSGSDLVGFVSGYLIPARRNTLFIWQVAVAENMRGQGTASRMLQALLNRPACRDVAFLETTIAAPNAASQALFRKLGATLKAAVTVSDGFDEESHFRGCHESEQLWRIGPFTLS
jgi:L-2,4-diaminobutyric acid acetyltransferase